MKLTTYQREQLQEAIRIMRGACARAESELQLETNSPERLIAYIVHQFLWGLANANSGIESALSECARVREKKEAL